MDNQHIRGIPFVPKNQPTELTSQESGKSPSRPMKSGIIKITLGDKTIGVLSQNVFIKNLYSSRHFLRKPEAICFDEECIDKVVNLGATKIKIVDLDSGKIYESTIALLKEKAIHIDRGYGKQLALPLRYWSVNKTQVDNNGHTR